MSTPSRLLKDEALEQQLTEVGYVTVPFFDAGEIAEMVRFYEENLHSDPNECFAITHSSDMELKLKTNRWVMDRYRPGIERYFRDPSILGGTYIIKPPVDQADPGAGGERGVGIIEPHIDWNLVDESRFRSCNIWVPMVDVDENNGATWVFERSHKVARRTYRGPTSPNPCDPVRDWIWDHSKVVRLKAGHAFLYDHRLIHSSLPNTTDEIRIAIACAVTSSDATRRVYFHDEKTGMAEEFLDPGDFLLRNTRFDHPGDLESLGRHPMPDLSEEEIRDFGSPSGSGPFS